MAMAQSKGITFISTHKFLNTLFSEDVHAKRIYSLANATLGVISSASLAVNTIGQGLACQIREGILGRSQAEVNRGVPLHLDHIRERRIQKGRSIEKVGVMPGLPWSFAEQFESQWDK